MRSIPFLAFFVVCRCIAPCETPCFAAEPDRAATVLQRELGVTIGGGDGSSFEKAIIMHASNVETETVAEYEYITLRYRLWQIERAGDRPL